MSQLLPPRLRPPHAAAVAVCFAGLCRSWCSASPPASGSGSDSGSGTAPNDSNGPPTTAVATWADKLAAVGEPAVPTLLGLLRHDEPAVCARGQGALANMTADWPKDDPRRADVRRAIRRRRAAVQHSRPGGRARPAADRAGLRDTGGGREGTRDGRHRRQERVGRRAHPGRGGGAAAGGRLPCDAIVPLLADPGRKSVVRPCSPSARSGTMAADRGRRRRTASLSARLGCRGSATRARWACEVGDGRRATFASAGGTPPRTRPSGRSCSSTWPTKTTWT